MYSLVWLGSARFGSVQFGSIGFVLLLKEFVIGGISFDVSAFSLQSFASKWFFLMELNVHFSIERSKYELPFVRRWIEFLIFFFYLVSWPNENLMLYNTQMTALDCWHAVWQTIDFDNVLSTDIQKPDKHTAYGTNSTTVLSNGRNILALFLFICHNKKKTTTKLYPPMGLQL